MSNNKWYSDGRVWLFLIAIFSISVRYYSVAETQVIFSDFYVYKRALTDVYDGLNPYRTDVGAKFLYHPMVLGLFLWIEQVYSFSLIYGLVFLFSFVWFLREAGCSYTKNINGERVIFWNHWIGFGSIIFASFGFGRALGLSLLTGNISLLMHFALISSYLMYLRLRGKGSINVVLVLLFVFSVIKPFFLLYSLLFVFSSDRKNNYKKVGVLWVLVLIFWGASFIVIKDQMMDFLGALNAQTLEGNDIGYSFFKYFQILLGGSIIPLVFHGLASIWLGWFLYKKFYKSSENDDAKIFYLGYFYLTVINPRVKNYDMLPGVLCYFLFVSSLVKSLKPLVWGVVASMVGGIQIRQIFGLLVSFFILLKEPEYQEKCIPKTV